MKRSTTWTAATWLLSACAAFGLQCSVSAQTTLLSNLDQPTDPSSYVVGLNQYLAAPFVTGDRPAMFGSATLPLMAVSTSQGLLQVRLCTDAGGLPGTTRAGGVLDGPSAPRVGGLYIYSAAVDLLLAPNRRYWLVAESDFATPNANYGWHGSMTHDFTSDVGWNLPGYLAFSSDLGETWRSNEDAMIPRPLKLEIVGTVVPEPSAVSILGGALALVGMNRRLAKNRQK